MTKKPVIDNARAFKPGDPEPVGYIDWYEWADVQIKAGLKTKTCAICRRFYFPQSMSKRNFGRTITRGKNKGQWRRSHVCLGCEDRAVEASDGKPTEGEEA